MRGARAFSKKNVYHGHGSCSEAYNETATVQIGLMDIVAGRVFDYRRKASLLHAANICVIDGHIFFASWIYV